MMNMVQGVQVAEGAVVVQVAEGAVVVQVVVEVFSVILWHQSYLAW